MAEIARRDFVRRLKSIYERSTGKTATDEIEGAFANFVRVAFEPFWEESMSNAELAVEVMKTIDAIRDVVAEAAQPRPRRRTARKRSI